MHDKQMENFHHQNGSLQYAMFVSVRAGVPCTCARVSLGLRKCSNKHSHQAAARQRRHTIVM